MTQDISNNRDKIALAATQLFIRRGFTGAPIAQISKSCGISVDGIKREFTDKEAILVYIMQQIQASLDEHVFSIPDDSTLSQYDKLEKMNNLLKEYFLDNKGCLIAMIGMDADVISDQSRGMLNDIFQAWKAAYKKIFIENHPEKEADVLATNAILFIEGAIVWLRVTGEDKNLIRAFDDIQGYLTS